ncbi:MAG: flagellar biosynthetic protein FliO [Desulfobulbus sp.]|nr:flagellar biosynthetic protein FliO [Desulfobulbus sp.]
MPWVPVLLLILWPVSAWAAEPPDITSALLRTGWALLVVIGLILALYALSKKRLLPGTSGTTAIKLIEMRPLQPKASLALVEIRGQEFLLGVSADSIHLLADLSANPVRKPTDCPAIPAEQP